MKIKSVVELVHFYGVFAVGYYTDHYKLVSWYFASVFKTKRNQFIIVGIANLILAGATPRNIYQKGGTDKNFKLPRILCTWFVIGSKIA